MFSGGEPATLTALAIAAGTAVAGSGITAGAQYAMRPDSPPELSAERKKALGSFGERMAGEEEQFREASSRGSLLLRPGGRPIGGFNRPVQPNQPLAFG